MTLTRILVLLFLLCCAVPANALVLRGLANEVPNGKSIVFISNGQRLLVVLKGVDAPELKQEFGDLAQQHLAALVLGKRVSVEFTELTGGQVVGKVVYNQMDIGLQAIRDGAAWYDSQKVNNLSEADQRIYKDAEQAARKELRGIWKDGSPMPPWEWRRVEAEKAKAATYRRNKPTRGLDREDVWFSKSNSGPKNRVGSAKPSARPLNTPGLDYDFKPYLAQGRISIVYFYADWCPACRGLSPAMARIHSQVPDMQVLFMNIGNWNTPVTQRYGVSFVPYLKIYDKSGNLVAEGKAANAWLQQEMTRRM